MWYAVDSGVVGVTGFVAAVAAVVAEGEDNMEGTLGVAAALVGVKVSLAFIVTGSMIDTRFLVVVEEEEEGWSEMMRPTDRSKRMLEGGRDGRKGTTGYEEGGEHRDEEGVGVEGCEMVNRGLRTSGCTPCTRCPRTPLHASRDRLDSIHPPARLGHRGPEMHPDM